jgi:dTDP-D-glucose 4,6-dehydratase
MDPKKAVEALGWKPRWSLDEGLKHMVGWYQSHATWWEPKAN